MCEIKRFLLYAIFLIFDPGKCLVTLSKVEDNDIIKAESVIRETFNSIFIALRFKELKDKPLIKHYSLIHNYFISLTLQDYNSLKEIGKLTRVDKSSLSNVTIDYIAVINEILDEDHVLKLANILMDEGVTAEYDIDSEIEKLEDLKKYAEQENRSRELNKEIIRILQQENTLDLNVTTEKAINEENENILHDLPTWGEEDELTSSGRKVYNGKVSRIKKFPFVASVQIFNKFQCGGSIIKSDLVITAASCLQLAWNNRFYRENPIFLSVRVGSSFYEFGGELIGVLEVFFHPSYNPKNLWNNIAVLRLQRRIHLRNKRVKKIQLDTQESALPINVESVDILGWGADSVTNRLHGPWSNKLRHASLRVYSLKDCQDVYSKEYVTHQNFCAGSVSVGSGACDRDVGGPGVVSGKLTGIVSFGAPTCGTPDAPTVFTKVGFYRDWIEDIMEQNVPNVYKATTEMSNTYPYHTPKWYIRDTWTALPLSTVHRGKNITIGIEDVIVTKSPESKPKPTAPKYDLRHQGKKLFVEFLKTMFDSAEIDEYLHNVREEPKFEPKQLIEPYSDKQELIKKQAENQKHVNLQPLDEVLEQPRNNQSELQRHVVIGPNVQNSLYLSTPVISDLEPRSTAILEEPTTISINSDYENRPSKTSEEISPSETVNIPYNSVTKSPYDLVMDYGTYEKSDEENHDPDNELQISIDRLQTKTELESQELKDWNKNENTEYLIDFNNYRKPTNKNNLQYHKTEKYKTTTNENYLQYHKITNQPSEKNKKTSSKNILQYHRTTNIYNENSKETRKEKKLKHYKAIHQYNEKYKKNTNRYNKRIQGLKTAIPEIPTRPYQDNTDDKNVDDAVLTLLYLSDSEEEKNMNVSTENNFAKKKKEKKKYKPKENVHYSSSQDLTYRVSDLNQDNSGLISDLSKILSEDDILDFLEHELGRKVNIDTTDNIDTKDI